MDFLIKAQPEKCFDFFNKNLRKTFHQVIAFYFQQRKEKKKGASVNKKKKIYFNKPSQGASIKKKCGLMNKIFSMNC